MFRMKQRPGAYDDLRWLQEHKELLRRLGEEATTLDALEAQLRKKTTVELKTAQRWHRAIDPQSGHAYWYDEYTSDSMWEEEEDHANTTSYDDDIEDVDDCDCFLCCCFKRRRAVAPYSVVHNIEDCAA